MQRVYVRFNIPLLYVCLSLLAVLLPLSVTASERTLGEDENVIEMIRFGAKGVEIHLHSTRAFPVRALPPILNIGPARFTRSYRPQDGDLNRLIFLLPRKAYVRLKDGAPVLVLYGQGASAAERWEFGAFAKR